MNSRILGLTAGTILVFGLTGCGSAQDHAASGHTQHEHHNQTNTSQQQDSVTSNQSPLEKAFQDELTGFSTIEDDINKGNYKDATTIADNLHEEFHAVIFPPLKDKKGNEYAESIHGKYDELQDAIKDQNTKKISDLIKVNRDNLHTVAGILGISLSN